MKHIQNWINEVKNKTTPQLIPDVDLIDIESKTVVVFFVPEYPIKPVSTRGRYYKRVANANHLMSVAEIADLYAFTMQNSWDSNLYKSKRITESELSTDHYQASTRNKLLAEELYLTSDIEKYGSGLFVYVKL